MMDKTLSAVQNEQDVRNKALEEAATECERMMMYPGGRQESAVYNNVWDAARGIRAMVSAPVPVIAQGEREAEQFWTDWPDGSGFMGYYWTRSTEDKAPELVFITNAKEGHALEAWKCPGIERYYLDFKTSRTFKGLSAASQPSQPAKVAQPDSDAQDARRFAGMVLSAHRNDGYPSDMDGGTLQQFAIDCGLIEEREVMAPCGDTCTCAEVLNDRDWPTQCYFLTESGKSAIDASLQGKEVKS